MTSEINKGWTPRPTITIDCVEIEIAPDNWIMAVDANNTKLVINIELILIK